MDLLPVAVDLARLTIVPSGDDDARTVYAARMARGVGKASEAQPTPTPLRLPPSLTATILITSANSGVHSTHDTYVQQHTGTYSHHKKHRCKMCAEELSSYSERVADRYQIERECVWLVKRLIKGWRVLL